MRGEGVVGAGEMRGWEEGRHRYAVSPIQRTPFALRLHAYNTRCIYDMRRRRGGDGGEERKKSKAVREERRCHNYPRENVAREGETERGRWGENEEEEDGALIERRGEKEK